MANDLLKVSRYRGFLSMTSGITYIWTGADGTTNWNDPKNWGIADSDKNVTAANAVPGSNDSVVVMSGNSLNQAGYTYNGSANDMNNAVKNTTPALSGSNGVTVTNVTMGTNVTLATGSTPFTVTGTFQDGKSAGFTNAQGGGYTLTGTNIHLVHLVWGTGGNVTYGSGSTLANVNVDWMSGAGQNGSGNNSTITVTQGYDVDSSGNPSFANGKNGNNNFNVKYGSNAQKRYPGSCFLAGSLIRTVRGDVAVEEIGASDSVVAIVDGVEVARPVVRVGRSRVTVNTALYGDEAQYPVRIAREAIAEGRPDRDLLVTPEHCLLIDERFVPVRMLVNGMSIRYETSIVSYDHYHVETVGHSVIVANNLLTESHLDTGRRHVVHEDETVVRLNARALNWADDAAAPLDVSRAFVEPRFRALERRALRDGFEAIEETRALTEESDLHLVMPGGQVLRPSRRDDACVVFTVPAAVSRVRVVSRASRPSDTIGPFVDDRRRLGVLVGAVTLSDAEGVREIGSHLVDHAVEGWSVPEQGKCRWTDGDAVLELGMAGSGTLSIQILAGGPYHLHDEVAVPQRALLHAG